MRLYSFKDLSGVFTHPLAGMFPLAGQIGMKTLTVAMVTEKTHQDVGADGTVMVSYISGNNGTITMVCQQTSDLHRFLLNWYNLVKNLAEAGDVTTFAGAALTFRNLLDGSQHYAIGVSIPKLSDKAYAAQGGDVTWALPAANIENE